MSFLSKATDSVFPGLGSFVGAGGSPSGNGDSGEAAAAEEARKAALRKRIDKLYGIGHDQLPIYGAAPEATQTFAGYGEDGSPMYNTIPGGPAPVVGYQDDPEDVAARSQLESEKTKLGDATRAYYTDQLGRDYQKAERSTRFKLARQGLAGGSEDIFQQGEVNSDRDLGATRVDEAVRRAIGDLETQREQERLSATNLVNSGAGDSAVSAAQAGLRNSLNNVSNQQKTDLFSDLFSGAADAGVASNMSAQQAALLGRYRDRLSTFFPTSGTSSGRVTPTS